MRQFANLNPDHPLTHGHNQIDDKLADAEKRLEYRRSHQSRPSNPANAEGQETEKPPRTISNLKEATGKRKRAIQDSVSMQTVAKEV